MPEEALELSALRPAVWVVLVVVVSVVLDPSLAVLMITSILVETGGGGVVEAAAALLSLPPAEVLLLPLLALLSPSLPWLDEVWDGGGVVEEPGPEPAVGDGELVLAVVEPACVGGGVELLSPALPPALVLEDGASEVGADDGEEAELVGVSAED